MSMERRLLIPVFLCLFLWLCLPAAHAAYPRGTAAPELLSGAETTEIVSAIYDKVGPRLGCIFVDANVVLNLAGASGSTDFYLAYPEAGDEKSLLSLNEILEPRGIRIGPFIPQPDSRFTLVHLQNLKGYDRLSKLTKLPFCRPFDTASGWEGLYSWNRATFDRAENAGMSRDGIMYTIIYLHQGWPDLSIRDYNDWTSSGRAFRLVSHEIPLSKRYFGGHSSFLIRPEHIDTPSIAATTECWEAVLKDFYRSKWHRAREKDPLFLEARRSFEDCHEKALREKTGEPPRSEKEKN